MRGASCADFVKVESLTKVVTGLPGEPEKPFAYQLTFVHLYSVSATNVPFTSPSIWPAITYALRYTGEDGKRICESLGHTNSYKYVACQWYERVRCDGAGRAFKFCNNAQILPRGGR
jgi:hypothetical protein